MLVTRVGGDGSENIARGKRVKSSSKPSRGKIENIVDGSLAEDRPHLTTGLWIADNHPWVLIDLGEDDVPIDSITVITALYCHDHPVSDAWTLEISSLPGSAVFAFPLSAATRGGSKNGVYTFKFSNPESPYALAISLERQKEEQEIASVVATTKVQQQKQDDVRAILEMRIEERRIKSNEVRTA